MKALSVSQPFADLIITGKKTIELRKWNTNFRGEFLIHAPIKIRTKDCKRLKINKKMVTGAIVGKATLYDVKEYDSVKKIRMDKKFHFAGNDFNKKKIGFTLKKAKQFRIPIPWKGQLGFFAVPFQKTVICLAPEGDVIKRQSPGSSMHRFLDS